MDQFRSQTYSRNGKETRAVYDKEDRIISLKGSITRDFTFDEDGNLAKIENCLGTKQFEYDEFKNLKKVTLQNGQVIEYKIDGLGRRVAKSVNGTIQEYYFWYDSTHLAGVMDKDGKVLISYLYSQGSIAPSHMYRYGQKYKIFSSPQGSVEAVYDSIGKVVQSFTYDEYGAVLSSVNPSFQPLGFNSELYDYETRLVRFGVRDYAKDSLRFDAGDTNLFGYVANDPVNRVDPTGLAEICRRSLSGRPMQENAFMNLLNLEMLHEQIFYDDGSSVGYFNSGVENNGENKSGYKCEKVHYDDQRMKDAVKRATSFDNRFTAQNYSVLQNNCQDFVDRVRFFYLNPQAGK